MSRRTCLISQLGKYHLHEHTNERKMPNVDVDDSRHRWEMQPGASVKFSVPDNWKSGRIWGRQDCDFSTNPGPNSCVTGGCNGGLLCDKHTGTVSIQTYLHRGGRVVGLTHENRACLRLLWRSGLLRQMATATSMMVNVFS